jgi:hypothetical protein
MIGFILYLVPGIAFASLLWALFLVHFAPGDKKLEIGLYFIFIVLTWPYPIFAYIIAVWGKLAFNDGFYSKMPMGLYFIILVKMYDHLYGVNSFPNSFEEYYQRSD